MFVADVKCSQATWQTVPLHNSMGENHIKGKRAKEVYM